MTFVHPVVAEVFRAQRDYRMALDEAEKLIAAADRLCGAYLDAFGQPEADSLFASWEAAQSAANLNIGRSGLAQARWKAANAAFDMLPQRVAWGWLETVGNA